MRIRQYSKCMKAIAPTELIMMEMVISIATMFHVILRTRLAGLMQAKFATMVLRIIYLEIPDILELTAYRMYVL